jgi:hypothetical protein
MPAMPQSPEDLLQIAKDLVAESKQRALLLLDSIIALHPKSDAAREARVLIGQLKRTPG